MKCLPSLLILTLMALSSAEEKSLPKSWLSRWQQPMATDRPLKIVHGIDLKHATEEGMRYYQERGLGGLVVNVDFDQYLASEKHWQTLLLGLQNGKALGLNFWLYDEQGYPSGAAGGLVLQENPQYEALELAYDASQSDPFILRPAFEFTHAANNFYAVRRYINIMDDRAVNAFIRHTHERYQARIKSFAAANITAFFTDEPSLIAVDLGHISEPHRSQVPIRDSINTLLPELPSVPWVYDMEEQFQLKYNRDLHSQRKSLFIGTDPQDKLIRRQFWALVADLVSERYFGALQRWCQVHGTASSGHTLREESLIHHVPLEGNAIKALSRMDIPGLDLLSSDPEKVLDDGWLIAALPFSAARMMGHRRIMTEVSDFDQTLSGQPPVSLEQMRATAAWQSAWGVTDFTLYYDVDTRPLEEVKAYSDFIGRMNAVLADADPQVEILLYYPIEDLWQEYLPVGKKLSLESQSSRAQHLIQSFRSLGYALQSRQLGFALIDHELLASARVQRDGSLGLGNHRYSVLILPDECKPDPGVENIIQKMQQNGGLILQDNIAAPLDGAALTAAIKPRYTLAPANEKVIMNLFKRDGRFIILATNVSKNEWQGNLVCSEKGPWLLLDPAAGTIRDISTDVQGYLPLRLSSFQTALLIK